MSLPKNKHMKILFLSHMTDPTAGGWGRYTHDLMSALRELGHEVKSVQEVLGNEEGLHDPLSYLSTPFVFLLDAGKIKRAIGAFKPDVVHITVEPYALLVPYMPEDMHVVLTVHGSYAYLPAVSSWFWAPICKRLYTSALKRIRTIIAVSEYTKAYLLKNIEAKIDVVHNGIATNDAVFAENPTPKEKKIILTVAPLKRRKGIVESLRAVARYKKEYRTSVEYRIVGSHDTQSAYSKSVADEIRLLGLSDTVVLTGRVSEEMLRQEYAQADLFLMLPLVKEPYFEGFGLVYLEANAAGVPAIGSSEGGSREAIEEGVSGYVVDPNDPAETSARIHDILDTGSIDRARARAWAENHDIKIVAEKLLEIYRGVMSS